MEAKLEERFAIPAYVVKGSERTTIDSIEAAFKKWFAARIPDKVVFIVENAQSLAPEVFRHLLQKSYVLLEFGEMPEGGCQTINDGGNTRVVDAILDLTGERPKLTISRTETVF
jgi:F420-dependent methylenetetrahydromethanopterin dehydrogenase